MADQTAQELINLALIEIGAIAAGETASSEDIADALTRMKVMFRAWAVKGFMIYTTGIDTHTLVQGTTSYTIGDGATIDTDRPTVIRTAYVTSSGVDYPLRLISEREYAQMPDKDLGHSWPAYLWYKPTYPNGTIYLWPPGSGTLNLHGLKQLSEPDALTDDVQFPGEYDEAIIYNLARRLAGGYGKVLTADQVQIANDSMDDIEALNFALDIGAVKTEPIKLSSRWHIDAG